METIAISATTAEETYRQLLPQIKALTEVEMDATANLGNIAAVLHQAFGWHWVGFYIVQGNELVLGPFQGPVACTRIGFGKGVCGAAWERKATIRVDDVDAFPGHIACSSASRSEIVLPVFYPRTQEVLAVLDVDANTLGAFSAVDEMYLAQVCNLAGEVMTRGYPF